MVVDLTITLTTFLQQKLQEDNTATHSPTHNALCGAALETHTP